MTPERRKEIASRGGKSVSPANRAFARNPELATEAGRKGGQNLAPEARAYSKDRDLASAAGKKGGAISTSQDANIGGVRCRFVFAMRSNAVDVRPEALR